MNQEFFSRRGLFLAGASALSSALITARAQADPRRMCFADDPFTLGVASGDPDSQSVVIWTKLAPKPLEPDGGMAPNAAAEVQWEVFEDEAQTRPVKSGKVKTGRTIGHSVHIEVDGLQPDRWYWYRFHAGDATSPVGRTRTLPAGDARPERLRFGVASCQHFETGYFTAYRQMAADNPDLVFHVGDYIYEGSGRDGSARKHEAPRLQTIADYRIRYSQYRTDPDLQKMHALCPWFVTWDDHEVENNYANDISQILDMDPAQFLLQRAAAYQAYWEIMPLRRSSIPKGPDMQLYRKASYGRLAELFILDTRQYRTDQPNGDKSAPLNEAALNPKNTIMGAAQKRWLMDGMRRSGGRWNLLAQQVMMGMNDITAGPEKNYSMDQWPGYAHERMELVRFMKDRRISNPVVVTGDIHSNWVNDLRVDDRELKQPVVATEFVGTSITSGGNGQDKPAAHDARLAENPGCKFYNTQRGYLRCTVTDKTWQTDYVVMDKVTEQSGTASVRASFVVEAGKAGVQTA
ncbi:MAG: alkaline phosphatase D family protein [Armatimonas sp.]